jgi:hypothetical protein
LRALDVGLENLYLLPRKRSWNYLNLEKHRLLDRINWKTLSLYI